MLFCLFIILTYNFPLSHPPQTGEHPLRTTLLQTLTLPGLVLGSGLQLWFNYQSRTFAGKYKLTGRGCFDA